MRIKLFLIFYLFSCCIFSQNAMELDSIQVVGFRSSKLDPVPFTTIESDSIRRITNSNSDPFFTISKSVPNSLSQSDNGTQYGYSYLRIRGMDQTRINFTLNGIPMNEMEDQGIYFSNMPGFYNSISRMDVSRGIGISKYGSTSVVGSINMETKSPISKEMIAQMGFGSFGTSSTYLDYSSGLLGKFAFSSSMSYLQTNGFRENSGSDGHTYFGQVGHFSRGNIIKLLGFIGESKNQLSYIPIDRESLSQNYRINLNHYSDKDRFAQRFSSINWINSTINNTIFSSSIYFNNVDGKYSVINDEYGIVSYQGGGMSNVLWRRGPWNVNIGLNFNLYQRNHRMVSLDTTRYSNIGNKNDLISYVRMSYALGNYSLFGDIQHSFKYIDENGSSVVVHQSTIKFRIGLMR